MASNTSRPDPIRLSAAQCRAVDRYAIEELGIPSLLLMENAGRNAAERIERWAKRGQGAPSRRASAGDRKRGRPARISVVCGKGNNGGDGFVIARHLATRGAEVSVDVLGELSGLSGDAAVNCAIVQKMGLPVQSLDGPGALTAAVRRWRRSTVVVDALLGTGFEGEVREPMAGVIRRINTLRSPLVVAVDVPSGLNADTGMPGGVAVAADRTVTFLAEKVGFAKPGARRFTGQIAVASIGAPLTLILARLKSFRPTP